MQYIQEPMSVLRRLLKSTIEVTWQAHLGKAIRSQLAKLSPSHIPFPLL